MRSIFSVSEPRAGHHAIEMMLRASLDTAFRYCEYYTEPNCCQNIPCTRRAEFEAAGYQMFLQKSHDHHLDDPTPTDVTLILVQVREPILRALSNYELDLVSLGRSHSPEYLQFWLAQEALYVIGFWRKWVAADVERRLLLRYEHLVKEPLRSLQSILQHAGVNAQAEAITRGTEQIRFSATDRAIPFTRRTVSDSRYFDAHNFGEFAALLITETGGMGYEFDNVRLELRGPVTSIFSALSLFNKRRFEDAANSIRPLAEAEKPCRELLAFFARVLAKAGRQDDAWRIQERLLAEEPTFFEGYAMRAAAAYRAGCVDDARSYLWQGLKMSGNVRAAQEFLARSGYDPELLAQLPETRPSVPREAVIAGFRWLLGREPESEATIENHMRCPSERGLRDILLRSDEFGANLQRIDRDEGAAWSPPELDGSLQADDLVAAVGWILGRPLKSAEELEHLQSAGSRGELRARLMRTSEFREILAKMK